MLRYVNKLAAAALAASVATVALAQETYQSAHHDYRVVPVAEGLVHPWSMAWSKTRRITIRSLSA